MTVPTIAELRGNTVLELFENGYNTIKNDMKNKQDTLVAGDNIIIDGNVISAIEGGSATLDNYYTKSETDALLDDKADSSDVYDKEQIDDMLVAIGSEIPDMEYYYTKSETYSKGEVNALIPKTFNKIVATLEQNGNNITFENELKSGDIVVAELYGVTGNFVNSVVFGFVKDSGYSDLISRYNFVFTDATNYVMITDNIALKHVSGDNPYNLIAKIRTTQTVTNGLSSISYIQRNISAEYSKVIIYRMEE